MTLNSSRNAFPRWLIACGHSRRLRRNVDHPEGSYTALQFMFITMILTGLVVTWNRAKTRPAEANQQPTAMSPVGQQPAGVAALAHVEHPPVLKAEDAAAYLGVDVAEVVAEIQAGRMPGNRLGHRWLIRREALNAWLDGAFSRPGSP